MFLSGYGTGYLSGMVLRATPYKWPQPIDLQRSRAPTLTGIGLDGRVAVRNIDASARGLSYARSGSYGDAADFLSPLKCAVAERLDCSK